MEINDWWADDPTERFWLEITDRDQLGENLHAPQRNDSGGEYWSYELVRHVAPGDTVFHWWKIAEGGPTLVGYSRAVGEPVVSRIEWQAHGSVGRAKGYPTVRPSWLMQLADYQDLAQPLTLEDLRASEPTIRRVQAALRTAHPGKLYFPFALSDRRPIRTAQGYLTKFPAGLVRELPGLAAEFNLSPPAPSTGATPSPVVGPPTARSGRSGSGWMQDPVARKAVENCAVDWTMRYLEAEGYDVENVGAFYSYDVRATQGHEELHVEVKGTTLTASTIELTHNEVHEDGGTGRLLVVVDQIECSGSGASITASGGRPRLWWDWEPADENLTPTRYRYTLPDGATEPGV